MMSDYEDYGDYGDYGDLSMDSHVTVSDHIQELMSKHGLSRQEVEGLLSHYEDYADGGGQPVQTPLELMNMCVIPTLSSLHGQLMYVIAASLACRIIIFIANGKHLFNHMVITTLGVASAYFILDTSVCYLMLFTIATYLSLLATILAGAKRWCGQGVVAVCIMSILISEVYLDSKVWHQIRGAQMIMMMKAISVGCDVMQERMDYPNVVLYSSYLLNPGTCIFGPWISLHGYKTAIESNKQFITLAEIWHLLKYGLLSLVCVLISTCALSWFIQDDWNKWVLAYRDAQSFRFSHYFVGYTAAFTTLLLGVGLYNPDGTLSESVVVSKPVAVEFPRSFVEIVTNWDLPMHYWLKNYIFKNLKGYGIFPAIMVTYITSSLLHGLNFQISAVLLSLGIYSYVEFVCRKALAKGFDACIEARSCRECKHTYKDSHPVTVLTNLALIFLNIFHLAYLGVMFDNSSTQEQGYEMSHTLSKWANLSFASHIVTGATYIFYLAIK